MTVLPTNVDDVDRVYSRSEDTVTRTIAGETFIIAIRGELANMEKMFVLDEVAQVIWSLIDGKRSARTIAQQLTEEFDVDVETASRDTDELLHRLAELNLLHTETTP
ncbi:MAG: PqqD family protein [Myxococcota bacterium]